MGKAARLVQGANQKQIVKLFDSFNGRYSMYSLWQDFVVMAAIAISNTVDLVHREEREKMYLQISSKYTSMELQVFAQILSEVVIGMEKNPDQDFLGEMYMALEMGNDHAGQFFTPYSVCRAMASLTEKNNIRSRIERDHWISCMDCACGAGALLVAFANECLAQGVNYQESVLFVAQDIDYTVGCMCYIALSLLGCAGYVKIANSITDPTTSIDKRGLIPVDKGDIWYTPMYFSPIWQGRQLYTRMDLMAMGAAKAQQAEPERCESAAPVPEAPVELIESYSADDRGQLTFF
jgi:type I restriction-modification system DNA methylase subunit